MIGALLAVTTAALTVALMPATVALLHRLDVRDLPSARSSHVAPTLRGGGIAPALAAMVVATVASSYLGSGVLVLVLAGALLGLVGVMEDIRGIPPLPRLAVQLGASVLAAAALGAPGQWTSMTQLLFSAAVALWLISYANAFNFMDGINGISAAQAAVAGFGYAAMGLFVDAPVLAVGGIIAAGAGLGFLPFNFPRAKVFLGDTGSYFFGGWIGMLTVMALLAGVPIVAAVAPVAIYMADTGTTLARRIWRREPWHLPHKSHVYQRLTLGGGWSHARVTAAVTLLTAICTALGLWATDGASGRLVAAAVAMATIVLTYLPSPHLADRWRKQGTRDAPHPSAPTSERAGR